MRLIIVILVLCATTLFGQDAEKISYQVNLGTTVSVPHHKNVKWPNTDGLFETTFSTSFGYFADLLAHYTFVPEYGVSTGLNYSMNNIEVYDIMGLMESKGNIKSHYLQMPFMFDYHFVSGISASAGCYVAYLLSAKEKGTTYIDADKLIFPDPNDPVINNLIEGKDYNNDIKANYKNFDFGLSAQLDYKQQLNEEIFGLLFTKFNYGLTNVLSNEQLENRSVKDWQNINVMIGLGLGF